MGVQNYSGHARQPDRTFHLEFEDLAGSWKRFDLDHDVLGLHLAADGLGQVGSAEVHVVWEGHLLELIHHSPQLQLLLVFPLRKEQLCVARVNCAPVAVPLVQLQHLLQTLSFQFQHIIIKF